MQAGERRRMLIAVVLAWSWAGGNPARPADADPPAAAAPTWDRDVRPILKAHCTLCHGEEDPVEGWVDLRLRQIGRAHV